jgi:hypothetical protein
MKPTVEEAMVLKGLVAREGTGNVMEFLQLPSGRFDEGFAIANNMQNKDYVKLLYSNFNKNLIVVEITLVGKAVSNLVT